MLADFLPDALCGRDDARSLARHDRQSPSPAPHQSFFMCCRMQEQREIVNRQNAGTVAPQRHFVIRAVKEIEGRLPDVQGQADSKPAPPQYACFGLDETKI